MFTYLRDSGKTKTYLLLVVISFLCILAQAMASEKTWAQGSPSHIELGHAANSIRWSPDGRLLSIAVETDIRIYTSSLQLLGTLQGHTDTVTSLSWRPDGTQLVSGSIDGRIIIWNINSLSNTFLQLTAITVFQPQLTYKGYFGIPVAWSPDSMKIAVLVKTAPEYYDGYFGEIQIYETQTWALEKTINQRLHIPTDVLEWSPDSTRIAAVKYGCNDLEDLPCPGLPTFEIINVTTEQVVAEIPVVTPPTAARWSSANQIAIGTANNKSLPELQIINGNSYASIGIYETGTINDEPFVMLDWSPGNTKVAGGTYDGTITIVNTLTGEKSVLIDTSSNGILIAITWSPNGDQVITLYDNGLMSVWDVTAYTDIPTVTPMPTSTTTATSMPTVTSTPTITPTATITPTPPPSTLKLQYYPESTTRTQYVEAINPQLNIVNLGGSAVNLSTLKIRYYFTKDSSSPLEGYCDWTALPGDCANVTVTTGTLTTPVTGADSYIEVSFTGGTVAANSETQDIIVRANKQDWSDFDQNNDYSFDPTSTSDTYIDWTKVTLYQNDVLIWGTEP